MFWNFFIRDKLCIAMNKWWALLREAVWDLGFCIFWDIWHTLHILHIREAVWDLFQSESAFLRDHLMTIKNVFMEPLKKVTTPSTTISWWTSELLTSPTPLTLTRLMLLICQSNYIIKQWIYSYEYIWICPRFKSRVLWCLRSQKSYLATSMSSAV